MPGSKHHFHVHVDPFRPHHNHTHPERRILDFGPGLGRKGHPTSVGTLVLATATLPWFHQILN